MQGVRGRYLTGYNRIVDQKALATVTSQYTAGQPGGVATDLRLGGLPGMQQPTDPEPFFYHLPAKTVQYFDAGARWSANIDQDRIEKGELDPLVTWLSETTYRRGTAYRERWGASVAAPALNGSTSRTGNEMFLDVNPNTDQDGHPGASANESGTYSTRLFRNGKLVSTDDTQVDVAAAKSSYRLENTQKVPAMQLSTQLSNVWTFTSATTGKKTLPLPLWGTQFKPAVDLNNSVKRTATTNLPFVVRYQPKASVGALKSVQVWISGDGGKTWTKATVVSRRKGNYVASFKTPAKTIALRSVVTDKAGNTATQTVTNAYRLR